MGENENDSGAEETENKKASIGDIVSHLSGATGASNAVVVSVAVTVAVLIGIAILVLLFGTFHWTEILNTAIHAAESAVLIVVQLSQQAFLALAGPLDKLLRAMAHLAQIMITSTADISAQVISVAASTLGALTAQINSFATSALATAARFMAELQSFLNSYVITLGQRCASLLTDTFGQLFAWILGIISFGIRKLVEYVLLAYGYVRQGIEIAIGAITSAFTTSISAITAAANQIADFFVELGAQFSDIQGALSAIQSGLDAIASILDVF